jgi:hypothetical protein
MSASLRRIQMQLRQHLDFVSGEDSIELRYHVGVHLLRDGRLWPFH